MICSSQAKNLVKIVNAYSFTEIGCANTIAEKLRILAKEHLAMGSILVAGEGINCSLSGVEKRLEALMASIWALIGAKEYITHFSSSNFDPFSKLKVMVKDEIVKMGQGNLNPAHGKGSYVSPDAWEEFTLQGNLLLVDTRNSYECLEGKFRNAVEPMTTTFKEFPTWAKANLGKLRSKKVAMYCTGGIRCEKASAYLCQTLGLEHVYQLEGGILGYLKERSDVDQSWIGNCFVFDDRTLLDRKLDTVEKSLPQETS